MSEASQTEQKPAFEGGFGDRQRRPRGRGRGRRGDDKKEWVPCTKLGRLVKDGRIKRLEDIFLFSLPIKEEQIVDYFLPNLKDEGLSTYRIFSSKFLHICAMQS